MAEFSEFLYQLRKEKNLTQSELAERLGITNKAVSKWETGDAMPDTSQLLPLAEILGVSVDELLRGERAPEQPDASEKESSERGGDGICFSDGEERVRISSKGIFIDSPEAEQRMEEDSWRFASDTDSAEISSRGVYINGKRAEHVKRSYFEKISGCICASLIALSVIAYILAGCFTGLWHPLWCIPASSAFACGIVGCVFDLCDRAKRERKWKKGENPYTSAVCGMIMCASLIVFLCTAAVCNLWHIMWISPVAGVCACIMIGAIGSVFNRKSEK